MMSLEPWLHLGHVLGAIVWVGGGLMLSVVAMRVRKSADPNAIPEFARMLTYLGLRVFAPAVLAVLVFGVWMVLISSEWNFGQGWVPLAIGLLLVAFLIGAVYLGRIGIALQRAADSGT